MPKPTRVCLTLIVLRLGVPSFLKISLMSALISNSSICLLAASRNLFASSYPFIITICVAWHSRSETAIEILIAENSFQELPTLFYVCQEAGYCCESVK